MHVHVLNQWRARGERLLWSRLAEAALLWRHSFVVRKSLPRQRTRKMSAIIFDLGFVLILLTIVWSLAIALCIVTRRAISSTLRIIGPFVITVVSLLSVLLLSLPLSHPVKGDDGISNGTATVQRAILPIDWMSIWRTTDWMHVWRMVIIIANVASLLGALSLVYVKWFSATIVRSKPFEKSSDIAASDAELVVQE